jgi:actin-related protein
MNLGIAMPIVVLAILVLFFIGIKYLPSITGERFSGFASGIYNIVAAIGLVAAGIWAVTNFELLKQQESAQESLELIESQKKLVQFELLKQQESAQESLELIESQKKLVQFELLKQQESAQESLKLIESQKNLAQKQYEELLVKISNVEASKIEISSEVVDYQGYYDKFDHKGLSVRVKLVNLGTVPIKFDLSKGVLKIYEVNADGIKSGYSKLYEPLVISRLAPMGDPSGSTPLTDFVLLTSAERTLSYFAVLPIGKLYYIVFKTQAQDLQGASKKECDKVNGCSWFVSKYIYLAGEKNKP